MAKVRVPSLSAGSHYVAHTCPNWQSSCLSLPRAVIKSMSLHNGLFHCRGLSVFQEHRAEPSPPWQPVLGPLCHQGHGFQKQHLRSAPPSLTDTVWHRLEGFIFSCADIGLCLIVWAVSSQDTSRRDGAGHGTRPLGGQWLCPALHSASSRLLTLPLQPPESQRAKRGPSITGTLKGLRLLYAVSSRCFS